jgi:hypothetical protein
MRSLLPLQIDSTQRVPRLIHGYVSVNSQSGTSCFAVTSWPKTAEAFHGAAKDHKAAEKALRSMGFTITAQSRLGMAVSGPPAAFEELSGGKVVTKERLVYAEGSRKRYITHLDIVGKDQPEAFGVGRVKSAASRLEGVMLERPRTPMGVSPSPLPPTVPAFHLRVPDDVALGLGATGAHVKGFHGKGVTVAMVDTGQYAHPFFTAHQYNVLPPIAMVPDTDPGKDPVGHGTGESANIFASAPEAQLQAIRASDDKGNLVAATAGFLKAKELKPQVLTNSWGGDLQYPPAGPLSSGDMAWALEIKDAVDQGIFVVFSAGNGQFSVEAQVPEIFSAGGVFMANNLDIRASDYASGYQSPFFDNRNVPDSCGLVGLLPRAAYIMLPIPPGCEIDVAMANTDQDGNPGDGTTDSDAWALFSGTSAAAPQTAGVAALILSAKPGLTPQQVKEAINSTAVDIVVGTCHPRFGNVAGPGPDLATGFGLVDASAAVKYAMDHFR